MSEKETKDTPCAIDGISPYKFINRGELPRFHAIPISESTYEQIQLRGMQEVKENNLFQNARLLYNKRTFIVIGPNPKEKVSVLDVDKKKRELSEAFSLNGDAYYFIVIEIPS